MACALVAKNWPRPSASIVQGQGQTLPVLASGRPLSTSAMAPSRCGGSRKILSAPAMAVTHSRLGDGRDQGSAGNGGNGHDYKEELEQTAHPLVLRTNPRAWPEESGFRQSNPGQNGRCRPHARITFMHIRKSSGNAMVMEHPPLPVRAKVGAGARALIDTWRHSATGERVISASPSHACITGETRPSAPGFRTRTAGE